MNDFLIHCFSGLYIIDYQIYKIVRVINILIFKN